MGKLPDPALHLRNKISDTHHQVSHCPRKLRNHTKHHQYNHANRKYDRKEQAYRSCQFFDYLIFFFAFLPKEKADVFFKVCSLTYRTFANFLTGQCLEAVILGGMFVVILSILRMPYALLIGILIAFTALIPIFGAFIGCAVGSFLIFMVNPKQAVLFIIVFLVLQQIEGNLIYPHVVGESVGLPSIWVLAAVTIGGNLMGIVGMLVFIPLLSVFYTIFREFVYLHLKKKHIKQVTKTEIEEYTAEEIVNSDISEVK